MWKWLNRLNHPRRRAPVVRLTDQGFALDDGVGPPAAVAWDAVQEILTYKRDLGCFDDIRPSDGWLDLGEDE